MSTTPRPLSDAMLRGLPIITFFAKITIGALLALNLALLSWFIRVGYRALLNSDAATKSLLAQEMLETGRVFPPDWNYVNGDLMVLFGQWFVLPSLSFAPNGYGVYAISSLLSAALILLGTWWAARLATPGRWPRLAMVAIVASGLSYISVESLFGQVSYGNVYFLACFAVVLSWRAIEAAGRMRIVVVSLLCLLSLGLFWGNPQRALASYGLPLLAAFALHVAMAGDWREAWRAVRWPMAALLTGLVFGSLLHARIIVGLHDQVGAGNARWLGFAGMADNLVHAFHGLLALLGCVPTANGPVVGVQGLWEAVRLVVGLASLIMLPVALGWSLRAGRPARMRFLGAFALVSFAIVFVLHVTTTIPDMTDPVTSARYLLPPLLFALMLLVAVAVEASAPWTWRVLAGVVVLTLAASSLTPSNAINDGTRRKGDDPRDALIAQLSQEGLKYGYASYWNAGALTVLSGQQVRVRQIVVERGLPIPMRHLGSNRWYRPAAWQGPTFLLLTDEERKRIDWEAMARYLGTPTRTFRAGTLDVVVYPRNPASVLPGWGDLSAPLSILMSPSSHHQVGEYEADEHALIAQQGQAGALHFGPYIPIGAGRYEASFDIECDKPAPGSCGSVDAAAEAASRVFATRTIPAGGRMRITLAFDVPSPANGAELRALVDGSATVTLRGITIRRVGDLAR